MSALFALLLFLFGCYIVLGGAVVFTKSIWDSLHEVPEPPRPQYRPSIHEHHLSHYAPNTLTAYAKHANRT
jgi:hypothetical protein